MRTIREHIEAAEALLEKAHQEFPGDVATAYSAMASTHIALADLQLRHASPRIVMPGVGFPDLTTAHDALWQIPSDDADFAWPSTVPIFMRRYPDNVLMGTKATHQMGDLSRDTPAYFEVTGETRTHYLGHWLEGAGFVGVEFPKDTVRPMTAAERERLVNSERVIA